MKNFIFWVLVAAAICGARVYRNSNGGVVPQTPRIPTIYNMPAARSAAVPLPKMKLLLQKLELPEGLLIPNIDSIKREIEATRFRLPEMQELPPIPDIDSIMREIEATDFRLPELTLDL